MACPGYLGSGAKVGLKGFGTVLPFVRLPQGFHFRAAVGACAVTVQHNDLVRPIAGTILC